MVYIVAYMSYISAMMRKDTICIFCASSMFIILLSHFSIILPSFFQAAEHGGLTTVRKSLSSLSNEVLIIIDESKKDDKVDADGDGIPDAKQISGRELIKRKVKLVLKKMDPEKVNNAIAAI